MSKSRSGVLLVDERSGSENYIEPLRSLGAPVETTILDAGDVAFADAHGRGVGVELKKIDDLLACITTGRFAGTQLPGLVQNYAHIYLIVEGIWRPNPADGVLEVWRGSWRPAGHGKRKPMYRDLANYLTTMEVKGGIHIRRTTSEDETARMVFALYGWYGAIDDHTSHLAFDRSAQSRDGALLHRPSLAHRIAAEMPGVGYHKGGSAAALFGSVRAMVDADEKAWMKVPGVGKTMAKRIVEAVCESTE